MYLRKKTSGQMTSLHAVVYFKEEESKLKGEKNDHHGKVEQTSWTARDIVHVVYSSLVLL